MPGCDQSTEDYQFPNQQYDRPLPGPRKYLRDADHDNTASHNPCYHRAKGMPGQCIGGNDGGGSKEEADAKKS